MGKKISFPYRLVRTSGGKTSTRSCIYVGKNIRELLGIKPGDWVQVTLEVLEFKEDE